MILVVGDVMTDVVVRPEGALIPGSDRRARIVTRPGGSGANLACWIAHLGGSARFAGRVGRADHARVAAQLRAAGVEPVLAADDALPTGSVVAIIDPDGERSFYTDRAANLRLGGADLPPTLLEGASMLHVSGHALFAPVPRAAVRSLMTAALARGIAVSVDAASHAFLAEAGPLAFAAWIEGAGTLFANAAEAAVLADTAFAGLSVLTRGADGAEAFGCGEQAAVAADPAPSDPDSTGAGDAFCAAFLVATLAGTPLAARLRAGVKAAAQALAIPGGRPMSSLTGGDI